MATKAKFIVAAVTQTEYGTKNVSLRPVTGGSDENASFYKHTPTGNIELGGINDAAAATFAPGKAVYVTFTEAE